jgi:hypothetical protein
VKHQFESSTASVVPAVGPGKDPKAAGARMLVVFTAWRCVVDRATNDVWGYKHGSREPRSVGAKCQRLSTSRVWGGDTESQQVIPRFSVRRSGGNVEEDEEEEKRRGRRHRLFSALSPWPSRLSVSETPEYPGRGRYRRRVWGSSKGDRAIEGNRVGVV